jgi:uncharacterized sulfatase
MKKLLALLIVSLFCMHSFATAQGGNTTSKRPPNVLFILCCKLSTDAIGAYSEKDVHTPNIDYLAETGMRFNNCYTPQSLCGPSRASILTGSYPHGHGLKKNVYPTKPGGLYTNYQEAIPDPFRDTRFKLWYSFPFFLDISGYATGHIGKWHLGIGNPGFFDYWKSFNSLVRRWVGEPHHSGYRPDIQTEQGIRFIQRHSDEPFFLYQSYYAPHEPHDPPKEYLKQYEGWDHAEYHATVSNLDWNVGRLINALEEEGILDNTLIIFSSDHGRTWRDRPGTTEGIGVPYDEVSRIPLIMRLPGVFPEGQVWQSGVSLVDLMPTILDVVNVSPVLSTHPRPDRPLIQGRSLLPQIRDGNDAWDRPIILQNMPMEGIQNSTFEGRAIRTERYKLILRKFDLPPELRPGELYDLESDPEEQRNLYEDPSHRSVVVDLAQQLQQWGEAYDDNVAARLGGWAATEK